MSEDEVKFSFKAGIPKENIQVLDNVLNELFSAINTKMKQADHFMKKVQNVQDSFHNRFESLKDTDQDPQEEEDDVEEDNNGDEEEDDVDMIDSELKDEAYSEMQSDDDVKSVTEEENTSKEEEEEVPHVFLVYENDVVVGYTTTIKEALDAIEELYSDFVPKTCGDLIRVERTHTGINVYKKNPLWYGYWEELIYQTSYHVILKV
jgi:hypothetical protein